jgi:hypothetical protein
MDVQFNEDRSESRYFSDKKPSLTEKMVQYSGGLIKDETQASYFLVVLSIALIIASIFFFIEGSSVNQNDGKLFPTPLEEIS